MTRPAGTGEVIEYERTYLPGSLPDDLDRWPSVKVVDVYLPSDRSEHPRLRVRRRGDALELTKKLQVRSGDASVYSEVTIPLTESEYRELVDGRERRLSKTRFSGRWNGVSMVVDVFEERLRGLALVDVEFECRSAMEHFATPKFFLADVTQESFVAGGLLAGRRYEDIETELERFGYARL